MSNKVSIIAALEKEQMSKEIPDSAPVTQWLCRLR